MTDLKEQIAMNLWHRFAPEGHMEWSEETHAAEYRDAADAVLFLARSHLPTPAQAVGMTRKGIAAAIARDLEQGSAHGARVATSPYLDNYHVNGHINLLALADAVLALAAQPPAAPVEFDTLAGARKQAMKDHASMLPAAPVETDDYSFSVDYGRDLLTDLNQLAHHRGTKTLHRDAFQRAFKEITRLRKKLSKLTCAPRSSAETSGQEG